MLQFTANDQLPSVFADYKGSNIERSEFETLPQRMEGVFNFN